jgi:hypothetical protein
VFELMNDTFQNFSMKVYADDESVNVMCGLLQTGYSRLMTYLSDKFG